MKEKTALELQLVKKKKNKKSIKRDISEPVKWTLVSESDSSGIDRLYEVYKKDKRSAKVLYKQDNASYSKQKVVLYEHTNGDINVVEYLKKVGIGKSGVIYSTEKNIGSIIYIKKTNSFWYRGVGGNVLKQLTYNSLHQFGNSWSNGPKKVDLVEYFIKQFGWLRNIKDDCRVHHISFNAITKNKLYNSNEILKHMYKVNLPTAKILGSISSDNDYIDDKIRYYLTNPEHITHSFMTDKYLRDILNMADTLGYKINPRWSSSRMKLEHDKWSDEISEIVMSFEPLKDLKISDVFKEFEAFSGYEMLKTNHDLVREGKKMYHCVGTYSNSVNSGRSCT